MANNKKWSATFELLLATSIWGFGFTASIWALKSFDSISISIIRFGVACVVGLCILASRPQTRRFISRTYLNMSLWPGVFIGLTLILQTWGLQYTSATNSSFITTLYIVMVPLIELVILRHKLKISHFLWVAVALVGTGLMINLQLGNFNFGDALTLACAITSSFQILSVARASKSIESAFAFNVFQSFWAALVAIAFVPIYGKMYIHSPDAYAVIGLLSLTFGSTLLAFFLQVKAQKVLTASISSLIFLLESPFASLFAFFLLGEHVTALQGLGGFLIFVAAYGASGLLSR